MLAARPHPARGLGPWTGEVATPNFREFHFRNCPKSLGGVYSVALQTAEKALFDRFRLPHTGQIHARSSVGTLFGQSRKMNSANFALTEFSEVRLPRYALPPSGGEQGATNRDKVCLAP